MGIFRSTDPTTWDDVDGIIVNESAPAPNVAGVAANIAILVGQSERGLGELTEVGSIVEFHELYGKDNTKGMNIALKNKKFGRLKCIRVIPTGSATASEYIYGGENVDEESVKLTAKSGPGTYGNKISFKVETATENGIKLTVKEVDSLNNILFSETFDNITLSNIPLGSLSGSKLVDAEIVNPLVFPVANDWTTLAGGLDGTASDADYQTAIAKAAVEGAGNFLFLDDYNATRNGYLETHAADTQDKMVILCGPESQAVSAAITDVANFRDADGRIIYAFPWVQTSINGLLTYTNPASWVASVMSQTAPNIDPASVKTVQFLGGITNLKASISRAQYIQLKDAGIMALENDSDLGFKIKSGIVTQIADSSKVTVLRRRMTDFLTNSAAKFLKNYQNAVNSKENRTLVKGALLSFVTSLQNDGILPKDADVPGGGKATLIDTESANTADSIAAGFFHIVWKQRIFSSMRYIVLSAQIGESVVVTDQG